MNELVSSMLKLIAQLSYKGSPIITEQAKRQFDEAHEILSKYRGDRKFLIEAVREFAANDSLVYAYTGTASILLNAAFEVNDKYDMDGLQAAEDYLNKARAMVADNIHIELVQAKIHRFRKQYPVMRTVLDKIANFPDAEASFGRACSEADYWHLLKDNSKYSYWRQESIKVAKTPTEELFANTYYAQDLMVAKKHEEAIKAYRKVEHLSLNDPWYFHNVSVLYMRMNKLRLAAAYNKRALSLADFGAARQVEGMIRERSSFWYQVKQLFNGKKK